MWPPLLLAFVLVVGCSENGIPGEECGRAEDCATGLICVGPLSSDGVGDQFAPAGVGGDGPRRCTEPVSGSDGRVFTDPVTGLDWQATPTAQPMDWSSAIRHCSALSLDGGGWRVPDVDELRSLLRGCPTSEAGGACTATTECTSFQECLVDCVGCGGLEGPASGCYWPEGVEGVCTWYWSSTTLDDVVGSWYVVFSHAHVCGRSQDQMYGLVRCVR